MKNILAFIINSNKSLVDAITGNRKWVGRTFILREFKDCQNYCFIPYYSLLIGEVVFQSPIKFYYSTRPSLFIKPNNKASNRQTSGNQTDQKCNDFTWNTHIAPT
ncbi:hypothetical protein [Rhodohalobacter sp. 8-1]|uniref:hypothetical protein n=1 Tax=Rhodohalobacter sp. 8-1 TaxID=3131972 RepID=UPI0030ECC6A9